MIKYFCDCCGAELTDRNRCLGSSEGEGEGKGRLGASYSRTLKAPKLMFEILTGKDGTWNAGDFCRYCVIDAVNSLDDRPRAAA